MNLGNYLIIIQARMTSLRLPGKVMLPLGGYSSVEWLYHRLSVLCQGKSHLCFAIPDNVHSRELRQFFDERRIPFVAGSEHNVYQRFLRAYEMFGPCKWIVRITADCPFIDRSVVEAVLDIAEKTGAEYSSNILVRSVPDGFDVEVIDAHFFLKASKSSLTQEEEEHVTVWHRMNAEIVAQIMPTVQTDAALRITLDTLDDYKFLTDFIDSNSITIDTSSREILERLREWRIQIT